MTLPRIDNFADLDRYLLQRSDDFHAEYEAEDHNKPEQRARALGKVAILSELRVVIARKVAEDTLARMVGEQRHQRPDDQPPAMPAGNQDAGGIPVLDDDLPDDHPSWGAGGRRTYEAG